MYSLLMRPGWVYMEVIDVREYIVALENVTNVYRGNCCLWRGICNGLGRHLVNRTYSVSFYRTNGPYSWIHGLTSQRYITEVLADIVVPYAGYIGQAMQLMHDNARPHVDPVPARRRYSYDGLASSNPGLEYDRTLMGWAETSGSRPGTCSIKSSRAANLIWRGVECNSSRFHRQTREVDEYEDAGSYPSKRREYGILIKIFFFNFLLFSGLISFFISWFTIE